MKSDRSEEPEKKKTPFFTRFPQHVFSRAMLCIPYLSRQGCLLWSMLYFIKIKIRSSCEIEDFVETNLCKLCVILRSRVLRVMCPR